MAIYVKMNRKGIKASKEDIAFSYAGTINMKKRRSYWREMRTVQGAFKKRHGVIPTFKVSRLSNREVSTAKRTPTRSM